MLACCLEKFDLMESVLKGRQGFVTVLSWLPMLFAKDENWAVPACAVCAKRLPEKKLWSGSRVALGLWLGLPAPSRFGNQGLGKLRGCLFLEKKLRFNLHERKQVRVYKARHVVPIELTGMIPDIFFWSYSNMLDDMLLRHWSFCHDPDGRWCFGCGTSQHTKTPQPSAGAGCIEFWEEALAGDMPQWPFLLTTRRMWWTRLQCCHGEFHSGMTSGYF